MNVCTGNSVSGNILANGDYDPEGTSLTVNTLPVSGPSNGMFSILPDGSFTYTPAVGYTGTDEVIISLCDNGIPLPPACTNDIISINVLPEAIANAGTDQNLCNQTFTFLNGNVAGLANVEWTQVSGPPCIIVLQNTPNAIAFGLIPGTYVFRYTVDNGSCSDFDEVTVVNWAAPTAASAGPDQSLCNQDNTILAGNTPVVGSGLWSQQSGPSAAVITDPPDPATVSAILLPDLIHSDGPSPMGLYVLLPSMKL
ncbi:MAG: hypothetical protein IPH20_16755 [Bacteroidales bacterium]|nr:hypothetical protein [Bacteroidales bacterium]